MNALQARKLKPGDRVTWSDGATGTVKAVSMFCIDIQWDDGVGGGLHPNDCEKLGWILQ